MAMIRPSQHSVWNFEESPGALFLALASAILFAVGTAALAEGQTFTVLHNFALTDGAQPFAGVTMDAAGNLYGTTEYGGILNCDNGGVPGCGVAYKLRQVHSSWILSVLYEFQGNDGGFLPTDPGDITLAPDGSPYGTQLLGGEEFSGTVFNLLPPATASVSANTQWSYKLDHVFGTGNDGGAPSQPTFDQAGNIFGAAAGGGLGGWGIVYELTPSGGAWTETILYNFLGGPDGAAPADLTFDEAGNIYGVTRSGGNQECHDNVGCGTVYELTPSDSGWVKTILHVFLQETEGGDPGPLVRDSAGNLFGLTGEAASGNGGTIWELSPSNGTWVLTVLYTFPGPTQEIAGPFRPVMDASGALYGVNNWGGANNLGSVYSLAPSNGGWTYTDLHDFGSLPNDADGCYPRGPVALDSAGNIYGTTQQCGEGVGDVFEVMP
jgi:hypothetical protein